MPRMAVITVIDQAADQQGHDPRQQRREERHEPVDAALGLLLEHRRRAQQHVIELAGLLADRDHPQGEWRERRLASPARGGAGRLRATMAVARSHAGRNVPVADHLAGGS